MDRKDSNTHTKKLASAAELRGKKSGMSGSKKGGKKMWISLISMVLVLGVAVGVYFLSGVIKPEEEVLPEATLAPSRTVKIIDREKFEVESVTIALKGQEPYTLLNHVTVTGEGEEASRSYAYEVEGKENFKLDTSAASSIIGYAANLTATQQVAEGVTDLSGYGLNDPQVVFTMKYSDGSEVVWNFGNQVPTGNGYYANQKGTGAVFVVYSTAYDSLSRDLNSLYVVEMPVTFADYSEITNLTVEQKGKDTVELRYRREDETTLAFGSLLLTQPVYYEANSERATEIFEAVVALTAEKYAGEKSELPEAGLDEPRAVIHAAKEDGVLTYKVGNFSGTDQVYVQIDDSDAVYLAPASSLTFLNNVNVTYLVNQFANLINIKSVDSIAITAKGEQFDLSITRVPAMDENGVQKTNANGDPMTDDTYCFNGEETTEDLFKDLYQMIIGTMFSKISDDWNIEGEVIASVTYNMNKEPGQFTVEYIEYDDNYCAVRRDNQTIFLIKKANVEELIGQLESFRDGTFEPLN